MEDSAISYENLQFKTQDGTAIITLDRPDNANTLNLQLSAELHLAAVECDTNPAIRAVVLTGNGKMFCAGGDLSEFSNPSVAGATLTKVATNLHSAIAVFNRMDAPLVIAINGTAAGAGFSLGCSGDYVIAAEHAKFTMAYTNAGLSVDGSASFFVAKHIGLLRTKELMLTNRVLTAEEAMDWGAVNQVASADELMSEALKVAKKFAAGATLAYGAIKRMLTHSYTNGLETQMEIETMNIKNMADTEDGRGAIAAFLNKEKAKFRGK